MLVKSNIECQPLAPSLRYAMERQRRLSWLESVSFFDGLTGLYNQHGFAAIAEHDIENACRRADAPLIVILELDGEMRDEFSIMRAGELLSMVLR